MDAAWIGVIGTAGGVGLGFAGTYLIDRIRWRRDLKTRWDAGKLEACADFEEAALMATSPASWLAVGSPREVADRAHSTLEKLTTAFARVNLLCGDEVKAAADGLAEVTAEAIKQVSGSVNMLRRIPRSLSEGTLSEIRTHRIRFEKAVQRELGRPTGR